MSGLYEKIYTLVRQVPAGKLSTYGDIAKMVDTTARQVGYSMAALPDDTDVPWHRIINSKGEISLRTGTDGHNYQRILLEDEGIEFNIKGKVDLNRYGWNRTNPPDVGDLFDGY